MVMSMKIYDFYERVTARLPRKLRPKVYRFLVATRMRDIDSDSFWQNHLNSEHASTRVNGLILFLATLQWHKTKFEEREQLLTEADGDPDKAYEIFLSWSDRPRCFRKPCWSIVLEYR